MGATSTGAGVLMGEGAASSSARAGSCDCCEIADSKDEFWDEVGVVERERPVRRRVLVVSRVCSSSDTEPARTDERVARRGVEVAAAAGGAVRFVTREAGIATCSLTIPQVSRHARENLFEPRGFSGCQLAWPLICADRRARC